MDINNFQFADGITMSIFAMLVVFIILILLQFIIYAFRFLPQDLNGKNKVAQNLPSSVPAFGQDNDEEERLVAMLTASALAKEEYQGNVKIKSVKRIG